MERKSMKQTLCFCIQKILEREKTEYAKLNEIYEEVASYLEMENNETLQSQIRGRLQESCEQYASFKGDALFLTESVRSGKWKLKMYDKKFIRYGNNKFLVSEDHWENVRLVSQIDAGYLLEDDSDLIYQGKLIQTIGKKKAKVIIDELRYIRNLLKKKRQIDQEKDGYGLAFEVFSVSVIHHIDYESAIDRYIIHGNQDGKIDAIYYGEDQIYIYQIKLGELFDNAYSLMEKNYRLCLQNQIPEEGKDLYRFMKKHESELQGKKLLFRSVSSNSKKDSNWKPELIYDLFFANKFLPLDQNHLTLRIMKPVIDQNSDQYNVSTDGNGNFIFYIKAKDFIDCLLRALGIDTNHYDKDQIDLSKYFSDNVRGYLSVNPKMLHTITDEYWNFIKYNNGISITGEVEDLGLEIMIQNPVINNGQQTITTLIKTGIHLEKIIVPIKITNETNRVIKGKISQYSNEQVKVKAIDILSLNTYVRNIQKVIYSHPYHQEFYFLNIYSSGKKDYDKIMKQIYSENHIIDLLDFIKLYYSVENKNELGLWKNSPNPQIEKTIIQTDFDSEKAFRVCEATAQYKKYISEIKQKKLKEDFQSADLAFKYLICKERLSVEMAAEIIQKINQKYFYDLKIEKSKLIDIYKSSTIIQKLEEELAIFRKNKKEQASFVSK